MSNKLTIAIALGAGLLGGVLTRAQAPAQTPFTNEVRAQKFTLVDQTGAAVATFTADVGIRGGPPTRVILRDANGREIWSAGGSSVRPLMSKP